MGEWFQANVVGLLGLLISIFALVRVESVKKAVRKAILRERLTKLLFDLGLAFQLARNLQEVPGSPKAVATNFGRF
jgi:hypothetical protein